MPQPHSSRLLHVLAGALLVLATLPSLGAPLPRDNVPDTLKSWVPWVLHGNEAAACPPAWNNAEARACIWPTQLDVEPEAGGGRFAMGLETFGAEAAVPLPGSVEHWPQDVTLDGKAAVVIERDGLPLLLTPAGHHSIEGRLPWSEIPTSLKVPTAVAVIRVKTGGGWVARQPDTNGQLWLKAGDTSENKGEALTLRSFRLIDDDQPLRVRARFELTFAGKPREVTLPHALLAGFTPLALNSPLPAKLGADGALQLQARAGEYVIEIDGRRMDRVASLQLPKDAGHEEIWSWLAHRDLRVADLSGTTVDPKQAGVPGDWQSLPAYLVRPGEQLSISERRRGDPEPAPDRLSLARTLWLDDDGGGYTLQDRISGTVSRSWRLESGAPLALGHVASDGVDQYITRMSPQAAPGFELRHGNANIVADSRIEGDLRRIPAGGWNSDFQQVSVELRLPPGWQLLHAGGVDRAGGAWLTAWTLWDVFFVVLIALATWKTFGRRAGIVLGVALVLTWQVPDSPGALWLVALAALAAARALPATRLARVLGVAGAGVAVLIVLQLLAFSVVQVRQALYPALETAEVSAIAPAQMSEAVQQEAPAAAAPAPQGAEETDKPDAGVAREENASVRAPAPKLSRLSKTLSSDADYSARYAIDAGTQVQTGPGLPQWRWHTHTLTLQGPVTADQHIHLWLLPPLLHALLRVFSCVLMGVAFWLVFLRGRALPWPGRTPTLALGMALVAAGVAMPWRESQAAAPPPVQVSAPAPSAEAPAFQFWLDALRDKLLAPPDCLPSCAQLPRLLLDADSERVRLRLEAHAASDTSLPLPGQAAQIKVLSVQLDDQPAALRRAEDGTLWLHLPRGVHQVVMEASVADAPAVNIALPLAPHRLEAKLSGWTLAGVDARGVPQGALTLTRAAPGGSAASETTRDALPPLVRVERTLHFADRWTVITRVQRLSPSLAPVQVAVPLLPGEQVTDASIRQADRNALLTLGTENDASFTSALAITPKLILKAAAQPNQVESWRVDADTRWHVRHSGLAPVLHQQGQVWLPQWQPWPNETLSLEIARPQGVPGASLTLDSLSLDARPAQRATDYSAHLVLRASLGGTHTVKLPEDAQLQSVSIDNVPQTLRLEGRALNLPIHPGSQRIDIVWRSPEGVHLLQAATPFDAGLAGVNAGTQVQLAPDRWILAVGGPRMGPAVLFWGTLVVLLACAWALTRSRITPLGMGAWGLLGVGVAQATLSGAACVAGWFLLVGLRGRFVEQMPRRLRNLIQVVIVAGTFGVIGVLFDAIRSGLLGTPDMLITGNGSFDRTLIWYQDRISGAAPSAWVFSLPLWVYRGLMLAWALWLAAGILKWVRWAWECFGTGGFWFRAPPRPLAPAATPPSAPEAPAPMASAAQDEVP